MRAAPIRRFLPIAILAMACVPAARASEPLRIIVFGAHPDDCEYRVGGTAALWAKAGHAVKFVAVTNGDIGHHQMAGGILARRRTAEVTRSAAILGAEAEVFDNHDGELLPSLENRRAITRAIRAWRADVVITHRPNDYHPDHRYTGVLVQDAAFMVTVPNFCPDVPALRKNPVFLYMEDSFKKPSPFQADVLVPIDSVIATKIAALDAIESQFYEWNPWMGDDTDQVPKDKADRLKWLDGELRTLFATTADKFRGELVETLGEAGKDVKFAEAFEICEYGTQPSPDELKVIFPFSAGP